MNCYDSICCFRSKENSKDKRVCWEITTSCNLSCAFCHRYNHRSEYYDAKNIDTTMMILKDKGINSVIISGGEPLLHPDLFEVMEKLYQNGFELDICTNGTIMNDRVISSLSRYVSEISISIDGMTAERHDQMRGVKGCFDKTISTVNLLIKNGFEVHVTTLVDVGFAKKIVEMTDFLYSLSVKSIAYLGLIPLESGKNNLLSQQCQSVLEEQIETARNKYPDISINTKQLLVNKSKCSCSAGDIVWGLGTDGVQLVPCLLTRQRNNKTFDGTGVGLCPGSKYLTQRKGNYVSGIRSSCDEQMHHKL